MVLIPIFAVAAVIMWAACRHSKPRNPNRGWMGRE